MLADMRSKARAALFALLLAPPLLATELYRWVDDNGVVHYSDRKSETEADSYTPETQLSTYSNVYFLQKPRPDYSDMPPPEQRRDSPDLARLQQVEFPPAPNDASVTAYIQRIYDISRYQKIHQTSDPQVSMLMRVGAEFLHLLIRETYSHVGWHDYGIEVIGRLAEDRHKAQIIDALKRYSKYARVIYRRGWHHEFQDRLVAGLKGNRGYVPAEWIRAVAEFERADARAALIEYFKYGWNNHVTYKHIVALDGIEADLARAIPIAWTTASEKNPHAQGELTPRALELGYQPAFRYLMARLQQDSGKPAYSMNPHALALRFTEQTGSDEEIYRWYRANRERIRFDAERKVFVD